MTRDIGNAASTPASTQVSEFFLKVCGITRLEDALHAAAAGATAVGFVFWPGSPRYVHPARVREIVAALPDNVRAVGVFVNGSIEEVREAVHASGVGVVQLHGDEGPSFAAAVGRPVVRSMTVDDAEQMAAAWPVDIPLLLDAADPVRRGGTGRTIDWARAAHMARQRKVILAGGLTDANVAEAIAAAEPFGVDVSSGVEISPGVKHFDKVTRFLEAARQAAAECARSRG